jgi:aldehyde:ferredoxin oxidoreductase
VLIFGVGSLGGTTLSTGRFEVTAKSPLTGYLGSSDCGGFWGAELKFAGYDHMVITGKAAKPVFIWIDNERVEIRDAASFWGKDTYDTQDLLRKELNNPEAKIACIGPAGENLVRFSTIQHDLGHSASRTGMGAVMGSKNLKAIAVRGTKGIKLADPKKFLAIAAEVEQLVKDNPVSQSMAKEGLSPFQDEFVELADAKSMMGGVVPRMHDVYLKYEPKRAGCYGCPIQCKDHYQAGGARSGVISCQLYAQFVTSLRCFDIDTSLECGILCQRHGLDAVSAGETIHWLMELYEKGIITKEDTDGIPMEWGSPEAIRGMLDKMIFRKGIGNILAEGILPAAKEIGRNSEEYANQVKGMPMPEGTNPDWLPHLKGASLTNAVGPRGETMRGLTAVTEYEFGLQRDNLSPEEAAFLREYFKQITGTEKAIYPQEYEGKPELVVFFEGLVLLCDMLGICKYLTPFQQWAIFPEHLAGLYSAGSGVETSADDLFKVAHKIRTLERAYEAGEGISREKDTLPKRFIDHPVKQGPVKGAVLESAKFEEMKTKYYELRRWDVKTGIPTEETLKELGLDDVAARLKKLGRLPAGAEKGKEKSQTIQAVLK